MKIGSSVGGRVGLANASEHLDFEVESQRTLPRVRNGRKTRKVLNTVWLPTPGIYLRKPTKTMNESSLFQGSYRRW